MKNLFIYLTIIGSIILIQCGTGPREYMRVGCVDIQKVFEAAGGKTEAENLLKQTREQLLKEKKQKEAELERLQQEYEAQKANMSEIELQLKGNIIATKKIELEKFIDESNAILMQKEQDLLSPIFAKIRTAIETVCDKRGFNLIVDKSTYVLYHEKGLDLTDEVIKELKRLEEED